MVVGSSLLFSAFEQYSNLELNHYNLNPLSTVEQCQQSQLYFAVCNVYVYVYEKKRTNGLKLS